MVNSKKLLSLFLAVVMVFSVLTVMASAYTVGPEVAGDMNFKYSVEKVDVVPETAAGSAEYTADNIYAVTVWVQSDNAIECITAPVHFDKTLFAPIMLFDGEVTYPTGAGFGVDDYYENMGEGALYAYAEGDYLNNTGMYKADGSNATTKALARCIGLGNANSEGVTITAELVGPGHPLYNRWGAGLPENTGVMYVNLDVIGVTKTAYLNTLDGINHDTGWNRMFTFYFETLPGVSKDDVAGAEFGVYTDDCFTVDGTCDTNAGYFVSATARKGLNPNKNVVENAFLASAPVVTNPIYHVKNQIQWADKAANTVNLGVVAGFDIADIDIAFNEAGTSTNVDKVGAVVTLGDSAAQDKYERFVYAANDGASYYFRTVIAGVPADYEGDIVVTPLVWMTGEDAPIYGEAVTISAADLAAYVAKLPQ